MQNETKEKMIIISIDKNMKILCFKLVSMGSVAAVYARPFDVLRSAILVNARGIIIVHNHPSDDPTPSENDIKFTGEIMNDTNSGGLDFLDHIIIGDGKYVSFAEKGLMDRFRSLVEDIDNKLVSAITEEAKDCIKSLE